MDWSPDGKSLIFSEALDNSGKARLTILSLSDLTARPLTSPHNQQFDCAPVFSPDGATVAFARGPMGGFLSDVFAMKVADGQLLRLTTGNSGGHAGLDSGRQRNRLRFPRQGFQESMANVRFRRNAAAVLAVRGMPMSPRSHAEGTNSLTRYLSGGTQFGGSTSKTSAMRWPSLAAPVRQGNHLEAQLFSRWQEDRLRIQPHGL